MSSGVSGLPAHRAVPGTSFAVDCFKKKVPGVSAFFLTHAHSDHYGGLDDRWNGGPVYCSEITARFVIKILGVDPKFVKPLPMGQEVEIEGTKVILVTANHCPGAVQFLFTKQDGRRYIHSGDMRFDPSWQDCPILKKFVGCDGLYLDTTYCSPKYSFPKQEEAIEYVVKTVRAALQMEGAERASDDILSMDTEAGGNPGRRETSQQTINSGEDSRIREEEQNAVDIGGPSTRPAPAAAAEPAGPSPRCTHGPGHRTLILIAAYGIGKERILFALRDQLGLRVHVSDQKMQRLESLGIPGLDKASLLEDDPMRTPVHVLPWGALGDTWPYFVPNFAGPLELMKKFGAERVVGFVPTGWMYELKKHGFSVREKGPVQLHLTPYSEHSSFPELQEYVRFLRPVQVIPTVGVSGDDPEKAAAKMCAHFRGLIDESAAKAKFLATFRPRGAVQQARDSDAHQPGKPLTSSPTAAAAAAGAGAGAGGGISSGQGEGRGAADDEIVTIISDEEEEEEAAEDRRTSAARASGAPRGLDEFLVITGIDGADSVRVAAARRLLENVKGDLARAADVFFSRGLVVEGHAAAATAAPKRGTKRPLASKPKGATATPSKKKPKPNAATTAATGAADLRSFFSSPSKFKPLKNGAAARGPGQRPGLPSAPAQGILPSPGSPVTVGGASDSDSDAIIAIATDEEAHDQNGGAGAGTGAGAGAGVGAGPSRPPANPDDDGMEAAQAPEPSPRRPPAAPAGPPRTLLGSPGAPPAAPAPPPDDAVMRCTLAEYDPHTMPPFSQPPVPYLHLAHALSAIEATKKRLQISQALTNLFRGIIARAPADLLASVYLIVGRLAPDHAGLEMKIGESTVASAVAETSGVDRKHLGPLYRQYGDLGDVALAVRKKQRLLVQPRALTVASVYQTMRALAMEEGKGSATRRQAQVAGLLRSCRAEETKWIVRTLIANLRIGAHWRSVLPPLGKAFCIQEWQAQHGPRSLPPKDALERAGSALTDLYFSCPSIDEIIPAVLTQGLDYTVQHLGLRVGTPPKPMLAKICEGIADALKMVGAAGGGPFLAEHKLDGMRAQIHILSRPRPDAEHVEAESAVEAAPSERFVKIFSRNGEDKTGMFPDVCSMILDATGPEVTSAILDTEVVGVERVVESDESGHDACPAGGDGVVVKSRRLKAFQELATRPRGAVTEGQVEVPIAIFAFDLLLLNGENLCGRPLAERRAALRGALRHLRYGFVEIAESEELGGARVSVSTATATAMAALGEPSPEAAAAGDSDASALEGRVMEVLMEALEAGAEGLMLKSLASKYEASKRSEHWVKIKRDYVSGIRDSLDLVPIGAWYGNGRKAGWFSPFLLAAYDPDSESFQSVCRCMSGFTDEFYRTTTAAYTAAGLKPSSEKPAYYSTNESCAVWFDPTEVWELRGADLTLSTTHRAAAGLLHESRGISLRFPRFIRARPDKKPEEATTPAELVDMFQKQSRKIEVGAGAGAGAGGGQVVGKAEQGTVRRHREEGSPELESDSEARDPDEPELEI